LRGDEKMKVTKEAIKKIINEEINRLQEKQWYDIKKSKGGSKQGGAPSKPKKKKSAPKPKKKQVEKEGGLVIEIHQDPTDKDCEDWAELIAIAKVLKMSRDATRALEKKAEESGCREVLDELDSKDVEAEAEAAKGEAATAAATAGGESGTTKPIYKVSP